MYIDIVIGLIMAVSVGLGIKKGMVFEFFSLFGILISLVLTKKIVTQFYEIFMADETSKTQYAGAFLVTFLLIYIILFVLILMFRKFINKMFLGWIDRALGGVIGAIKGMLFSIVILMVLVAFSFVNGKVKSYMEESYSGKFFHKLSPEVLKLFPTKIEDIFKKYQNQKTIDEIIKNSIKKDEKEDLKKVTSDKKNKTTKNDKNKKNSEINKVIEKESDSENIKKLLDEIKREKSDGKNR